MSDIATVRILGAALGVLFALGVAGAYWMGYRNGLRDALLKLRGGAW